jgi:LysM repeat protein
MTAARRAPQRGDEFEEPNMKLTSAFAVVLVLHVVAVGGIYAFNSLKVHKVAMTENVSNNPAKIISATVSPQPKPAIGSVHQVKSGETLAKIAAQHGVSAAELEEVNGLGNVGGLRVGQELKIPQKSPAKTTELATIKPIEKAPKTTGALKDSGQVHTVGKGETPVTIARKLNVSYDDLLKLNKIDDPKKLQIGQKLRIPAKSKS